MHEVLEQAAYVGSLQCAPPKATLCCANRGLFNPSRYALDTWHYMVSNPASSQPQGRGFHPERKKELVAQKFRQRALAYPLYDLSRQQHAACSDTSLGFGERTTAA